MPDPYRLPRTIVPSRYRLELSPDLDARRFEGTAVIDVTVVDAVAELVLNAAELEIHSASIVDAADVAQHATVTLDAELERATVTFANVLATGAATVTFAFTGTLNDDLRGFYRSTFATAAGGEQVIATTQFESTDARRAFPCWDEPDFKAVFDVSLLVPEGMLGLSNGPVVSTRPEGNATWVTFDTTMKMSTYLVAFIVGPLVVTDPVDIDGVALRVASVPGREHLAAFALDVGAHALRFFAEYFDIPYPAGKLDLVALPDFAFGAMENLGCVTFRETALLVDPDHASRAELERVADVVCHEIAHMWFGDLVTMKWWNGIWLNEAFATFMEIAAVDAYRPSWERWVSFSTERAMAMAVDGLASTRPIEYEVVSPEDADGMFDVLTYQKGGAVLRMLETYLGAERFREGIRLYLQRHAYANTETTDLWDAIEEATGEPVRSIMDTWIFQGGHPVITATADGVTQERFRYAPDSSDADARWHVPVLVRPLDGGEHDRILLTDQSISLPAEQGTIVVNAGGWGVFRTRYSPPVLGELVSRVRDLDPIERFNLVSDGWANTLSGRSDLASFLDLVGLLDQERDPTVWQTALGGLDLLHRTHPAASYSTWLRDLEQPAFASLGWEPASDEHERVARLRGLVVESLGTVGSDAAVIERCMAFDAAGLSGVTPDLWTAIVTVTAWNGGPADYARFWERVKAATTPQDEVRYLFRLSLFAQPDLLEQTLDATLGDIRSQNGAFVIGSALANRRVGRQAWTWLAEHWDDVLKRLPVNSHGRMLEGIVVLTDDQSLRDVPAFLAAHPLPTARKQVDQLLERQRINAAFARREGSALATRFA
ncbi:MAG: M1 family metallopeptidase [Acidimicrobiales bacterium]